MDLSVSTNFGYAAQLSQSQAATAVVRPVSATPGNGQPADSGTVATSQAQGSGNPQPQATPGSEKQYQEVRKKNPAADVTAKPGYSFEVDQKNHKIMKVSDSKGVLIYQVPSKGQLALIESEDASSKRLALTA